MEELSNQQQSVTANSTFNLILSELGRVLGQVSAEQVGVASSMLQGARRVFFVGAGRSALALRMAAMRLMHLGLQAYVAGDVTTPSIAKGDLLVAASASGTTKSVLLAAETARGVGADVLVLTAAPQSPLAQQAQAVVVLPAASKAELAGRASEQYAGSLFEQAVMLLTDGIFHSLWKGGTQSTEELLARHANLE